MDATAELPPAPALTHSERRTIVLGVLLPVFLGSLDQTILAGALPTMGREIGHTGDLPWLITTYMLAATAMTPLFGKISDIRGRRITLCVAIGFYLIGSLICALAPNFYVLILGRTLHGLGGGGLTSLSMVVLGDIAAPRDRGKYYAYFSATFTTAGALGPFLGGFIAEHLHWSVIFWINIPLGLLALAVVSIVLRRLPRHERPHRLDVAGALLIVIASVSFMLMLNIGGVRAAWSSPPVLALIAVAIMAGAAFVWRLKSAPEPLIPLAILGSAEARYAIGANAFGWGAILALNIYLPAYLQNALGLSATSAGLCLIVLMTTVNISAGIAGQVISRVENYKTFPTVALTLAIGAVALLAWQVDRVTPAWVVVLLGLVGFGFGPVAPLSTVVLQNSVAIHQFGTALGTMNFSRGLYSTILVAVFGVIVVLSVPAVTSPPEGYGRVFLVAAASFGLALYCLLRMQTKPLQTGVR